MLPLYHECYLYTVIHVHVHVVHVVHVALLAGKKLTPSVLPAVCARRAADRVGREARGEARLPNVRRPRALRRAHAALSYLYSILRGVVMLSREGGGWSSFSSDLLSPGSVGRYR